MCILNANFRPGIASIAANGGHSMRRMLVALCLFSLAGTVFAGSGRHGNHGMSTSIDDDGQVTANALNGPIALRESTGTFNVETTNGPISLDGGSGTAKLNAQNGPITVKLRGSSWEGNIEAHTQNGPASLRIPSNFRSGVVVESDGHGPVSCRAAAWRRARRAG